MSVLVAGFVVGMRHALDADHIAAMGVLLAERPSARRAVRQGVAWGLGHSLSLLTVGLAVIALDFKLSPQLAHGLEAAVGALLVVLGIDLIRRLRLQSRTSPNEKSAHTPTQRRALGIGVVHGLAGSSALILLTLSTLESPTLALSYIALFGVGSVIGMALLSLAMAMPLQSAIAKTRWVTDGTRIVASVASIGIGVWLMMQALGGL